MRGLADKRTACETVACPRKAYRQRLKYFEGAPYYAYSEYAEGGGCIRPRARAMPADMAVCL